MPAVFPDFDVPYYTRRVEPLSSWAWKRLTLAFVLAVLWGAFAASVVVDLLWRGGRRG